MLPEFIFTVGSSMQDLSSDDFNFINGANNATKATAKADIIAPAQQSTLFNTEPNSSLLANDDTNKFDRSLLRGIKLEDVQDNGNCCDLFTSKTEAQQTINEDIKSEETAEQWPPAHSIFNCNETVINNQLQRESQLKLNNHTATSYQQHQNSHQLLLQSSDDPLICHGANNDHSVELKHLLTAVTSNGEKQHHQQQQQPQKLLQAKKAVTAASYHSASALQKRPQNGCSSLTKQQLKVKAGLMSAANQQQKRQEALSAASPQNVVKAKPKTMKKKNHGASTAAAATNGSNNVKLRFHHQALPPEYLSHYEATQRRLSQSNSLPRNTPSATSTNSNISAFKVAQTAKLPPPKSSHENVRSWLQKIAEIQRAALQQPQNKQQPTTTKQNTLKSSPVHLQRSTEHDVNNNQQPFRMSVMRASQISNTTTPVSSMHITPSLISTNNRVVNYADLPYMGEITLNNSKPRRGRKPKKADICHLIYKNYGNTILAGVTQNTPLKAQCLDLKAKLFPADEQPLNLCIRDYQKSLEMYSISSEEDGNCLDAVDEDDSESISEESNSNSNFTTIPGDALTDSMLATNLNTALPRFETSQTTREDAANPILQPVKAYYQKLLESGMLVKQNDGSLPTTFAGLPIETIEKDNQIALKIPIPSGFFLMPKQEPKNTSSSTPVPTDYPLLEPEAISTPSSIKSEQSFTTTTNSSNIGCSNNVTVPQKRKRSAIFIPPMPAENTTNPANEVSICKFKFTGGAKPTLQEKKMLSVDSDGNYRYYSGTGDKSTRGYEFFPRESVQQSGGFLPGVNGLSGEKISNDIPPPSADLTNELLQIPESPTGTLLLPIVSTTNNAISTVAVFDGTTSSNLQSPHISPKSIVDHKNLTATPPYDTKSTQTSSAVASTHHRSKKRSLTSRRSPSQREKLEKTFKEKGFLIQTQQLESAEGATYCKFRQLKKFTRYLFRNWKDYLPDGQVPPHQIDEVAAGQQAALESFLASNCFTEEENNSKTATDAVDEHNSFEIATESENI